MTVIIIIIIGGASRDITAVIEIFATVVIVGGVDLAGMGQEIVFGAAIDIHGEQDRAVAVQMKDIMTGSHHRLHP